MQPTRAQHREIAAYLQRMQPLIDLWSHVDRQVSHELTAMPMRRMMGAHIEHLQSLYRGALNLSIPAPCRRAHMAFLAAIGATIDAYLATSEYRGDDRAQTVLLDAMSAYHTWRSEVARLAPPEMN